MNTPPQVDESVALESIPKADVDRFRTTVLSHATFEGQQGIWEPLWEAAVMFPNASKNDRERLVVDVLRELFSQGLIYFYREPWPGEAESVDATQKLATSEVEEVLEASWWRTVPLSRGDVWFESTPKAKRSSQSSE